MKDEKIMKNISIRNEAGTKFIGKTYYDFTKCKFVQIRHTITTSTIKDGFVCSSFCDYYGDSKTNICPQRLDEEYITNNLVAIDFSRDDEFYHDGVGWRCKNANE